MSHLPYAGIRIIELSHTLSGRLAGLLFADQGAEVFLAERPDRQGNEADAYLDRGKFALPLDQIIDTTSADVIITDGDTIIHRNAAQIVLRITASLPGDEVYGHLPADCSEDLLNGIVGFYTDMALTGRLLGRPVIYTPLPLCSVYTGVIAAVATAAALIDRVSCGRGREIIAARLAGGLSAIGALSLTVSGLAPHLTPAPPAGVPAGMTLDQFGALLQQVAASPEKQSWMEHRTIPIGTPYLTADGRMIMVMSGANRRATQKLFRHLGIWEKLSEAGLVDVSPYDPAALNVRGRNIAEASSLSFGMMSQIAEQLEKTLATKTAAAWEMALCGLGIPAAQVMTFEEWMEDPEARRAGITMVVAGSDHAQIGRSTWIASAQPYPPLKACAAASLMPPREMAGSTGLNEKPKAKPLEGTVVIDWSNVIAGPNCGRMLAELGATVYKVETIKPNHSPVAITVWQAESGASKRSIILDTDTAAGRAILEKLAAKADIILANKSDNQFKRVGLDHDALERLNPGAIGLQITMHHGEKHGGRHDFPGYDPLAQAITGIMERFGPKGCPTYHGLASCVDYLCGYLGAFAGVTALYARARRADGKGDWAESSLTAAASLNQLLLQFVQAPQSACGPYAIGRNAGERFYKLTDGWIFVQGNRDLSEDLSSLNVEAALAHVCAKGFTATRVNTVRELADYHRNSPTTTVRYMKHSSDGWESECFVPTWFCFDGKPPKDRGITFRIGSNAPQILTELGYSADEIAEFYERGVVGHAEWPLAKNDKNGPSK